MEGQDGQPVILFRKVITHGSLEDNTDEITFPTPVCLASIKLGAVPGAAAHSANAFVSVFARDLRNAGDARFVCLRQGLPQPATGTQEATLQPCITDHVVLRGLYQTVPISLHGRSLEAAAEGYEMPSPPPMLQLNEALQRLGAAAAKLPTPELGPGDAAFAADAELVLRELLPYWQRVGASDHKIMADAPPADALRAAVTAADVLCNKLAAEPALLASSAVDAGNAELPLWAHQATDMAMGWCGMLTDTADGSRNSSGAALDCAGAGLAAMALLCASPAGASELLTRHGTLLLADVLGMKQAPGSFVRHAVVACLLLAQQCGALGCEALLGWWQPRYVQWAGRPAQRGGGNERQQGAKQAKRERSPGLQQIPQIDGADDGRAAPASGERQRRSSGRRRGGSAIAWRPEPGGAGDCGQEAVPDGEQAGRSSSSRHRAKDRGTACEEVEIRSVGAGTRGGGRRGPSREEMQADGRHASEKSRKKDTSEREGRAAMERRRDSGHNRLKVGGGRKGKPPLEERPAKRRRSGGDGGGSGPSVFQRLGGQAAVDAAAEAPLPKWEPPPPPVLEPPLQRRRAGEQGREREPRQEAKRERGSNQGPQAEPRQRGEGSREERRREPEPGPADEAGKRQEASRREKAGGERRHEPTQERRQRAAAEDPKERPRREEVQEGKPKREQREEEAPPRRAPAPKAKEPQPPPRRDERLSAAELLQQQREAHQLHLSVLYWDGRLKAYSGVYALLAAIMIEVQPQPLAALATRLLKHLRFYECAAQFQLTAEDLVRRHGRTARDSVAAGQTALAAAECGSCLAAMAEALAAPPVAVASKRHAPGPRGLPAPFEPPAALLELLAARRVLPLLCAVLHVPSLHRRRLEEDGDPQAAAAEAAVAHQLGLGCKPLLATLCSSAGGLRAVAADPELMLHLLQALQPGIAVTADVDWATPEQPLLLSDVAAAVGGAVLALAAVDDLCTADLDSPAFTAAAETVRILLDRSPAERRVALFVTALRADDAFPRLLEMVGLQCAVLREASGALGSGAEWIEAPGGLERLLDLAPAASVGLELLSALLHDPRSAALSRWGRRGGELLAAIAAEMSSLRGCPAPGAAAVFTALAGVGGGVEAVGVLAEGGVEALMQALTGDLPEFLAPEEGAGGEREVEWEAVEAFWFDPGRMGRARTAMQLLTTLCWEREGPAAAAAAHYADGLHLLLRAVLTGTELAAAAQADRPWVSRAGAAIDPAASAAGRQRAFAFLGAAAAAMSAFLQQARTQVAVRSSACLVALIDAHALLCRDESSLLALLGSLGASPSEATEDAAAAAAAAISSAALAARSHLTSSLRCWAEAADWGPNLMQRVLLGPPPPEPPPAAGDPGTGPSQLFTAACLLGDLFPEEWPPPGRRAGQPPPSFRKYRAALAQRIEPCMQAFRHLLADCLTAEPVILRAALVRLIARAAGLGGGMGPFVAAPLVETLAAAAEAGAVHDCRRVLEVIVPLVYRPAIKSALLDTAAPSALAKIVGAMVEAAAKGAAEAADATSVGTMASEALMVLCNPEVGLKPMAPPEQAAREEVPPIKESTAVALALLEHLPAMGPNAAIGHRVLRLLAASPHGRIALLRAAIALRTRLAGVQPPPPGEPSATLTGQAAQWVANRFWGLASDAQSAGPASEAVAAAFADIVEVMREALAARDTDREVPPPPPPQRFVAALQDSIAAAAEAGVSVKAEEARWELPEAASGAAADIHDAATRMFWKNCRARAVPHSQMFAAGLRRYGKLDCIPDAGLSVAGSLHPPLTRPLRPRQESIDPRGPRLAGLEAVAAEGPAAAAMPPPSPSPQVAAEKVTIKEEAASAAAAVVPAPEEGAVKFELAAPLPPALALPAPVVQVAADVAEIDLYGDLGGDFGVEVAALPQRPAATREAAVEADAGGAVGVEAAAAVEAPAVEAVAVEAASGAEAAAEPEEIANAEAASPPNELGPLLQAKQPAPTSVAEVQTEEAAPSSQPVDAMALLQDPAAMAAVLQDPARMRELLENNPALLELLKARLGGK